MFIRWVLGGAATRGSGGAMEDDILVKHASVIVEGPVTPANDATAYTRQSQQQRHDGWSAPRPLSTVSAPSARVPPLRTAMWGPAAPPEGGSLLLRGVVVGVVVVAFLRDLPAGIIQHGSDHAGADIGELLAGALRRVPVGGPGAHDEEYSVGDRRYDSGVGGGKHR